MKLLFYTTTTAMFLANPAVALGRQDRAICDKYPDPHIRTWDGTHYDYHGDADLIACQGDVMDVHWRSEARGGWSAITKVAIRLKSNNDVLEILLNQTESNNGDCCDDERCGCDIQCCEGIDKPDEVFGTAEQCCQPGCCEEIGRGDGRELRVSNPYYLVNGNIPSSTPSTIGGYPFSVTGNPPVYELLMGPNYPITVRDSYGSFRLTLDMHGSIASSCVGTCGDWLQGGMTDRDGDPIEGGDGMAGRRLDGHDNQAVGDEWHVQGDDPELFAEPKGSPPEYVEKPLNPDLAQAAEEACKDGANENAREECEFDIMLTEDFGFADSEVYKQPEIQSPTEGDDCKRTGLFCRLLGGKCVYGCNYEDNRCFRRLCSEADVARLRGSNFFFGNGEGFVEGCSCAIPRRRG